MIQVCNKCKKEKDLSEFYKCAQKKNGHRYECKECSKLYDKYYPNRRKAMYNRMKEDVSAYYQENKERINLVKKEYVRLNREKINAYNRDRYRINKDK